MERVSKILHSDLFKDIYFCKRCANTKLTSVLYPCPECGSNDIAVVAGRKLSVQTSSGMTIDVIQFSQDSDERVQASYNVRNGIEVPFLMQNGDGLFYSVTVNKNHILAKMSTYELIEQKYKERIPDNCSDCYRDDCMIDCPGCNDADERDKVKCATCHGKGKVKCGKSNRKTVKDVKINSSQLPEASLNFFQKLFAMFRRD